MDLCPNLVIRRAYSRAQRQEKRFRGNERPVLRGETCAIVPILILISTRNMMPLILDFRRFHRNSAIDQYRLDEGGSLSRLQGTNEDRALRDLPFYNRESSSPVQSSRSDNRSCPFSSFLFSFFSDLMGAP